MSFSTSAPLEVRNDGSTSRRCSTAPSTPFCPALSCIGRSPANLGKTADYATGGDDDGLLVVTSAKTGTGTVTGTIGGAMISIPFTVTP